MHADTRAHVKAFNAHFFGSLGIEGQATLPCVVFFRVHKGAVEDIEIAQLESADLIHGFSEIYGAIEKYLLAQPASSVEPSRAVRWLKGSAKFLSVEVFRGVLKKGLELLF
ncbi:MAG: hypothetical protein HZB72_06880 [Burkholderiales bacterium]|nr:hypothetical protein [Burkholderiales bacterium]